MKNERMTNLTPSEKDPTVNVRAIVWRLVCQTDQLQEQIFKEYCNQRETKA